MAFTSLAVQQVGKNKSLAALTYSAVDGANGNTVINDGQTVFLIKNGSGVSVTVTVVSVPDQYGRSGDLSVVIAAGGEGCVGELDPALFNQRSGDVGQVHFSFSAGASVTMAAASVGT